METSTTAGRRFGLSSFGLKIVGCVCMVFGSIAMYVPGTPIAFAWIGQAALPIFLYQVGWSCEYTRSRRRYLLRLYAASVATGFILAAWPWPGLGVNVFPVLLHTAIIICMLLEPDVRTRIRYALLYVAWQVGAYVLLYEGVARVVRLIPESYYSQWSASFDLERFLQSLFGMALFMDYGLFYVAVGVGLWLCRKSRAHVTVTMALIGVVSMLIYSESYAMAILQLPGRLLGMEWNEAESLNQTLHRVLFANRLVYAYPAQNLPSDNLGWMMIFALPFMLLHNGRRGCGGRCTKWLFYVFYPVHIMVLFIVGRLLGYGTIF
ncbi:TraX protein [Bifidobacterium avesanii]|nr:TraX protein [Bifidobacterium avesanii]